MLTITHILDLPSFWLRACIAGLMVALVAAPLGCVMVWRRMAYFGDSLSHSGLLGVSIALLLGINLHIGVLLCAMLFAWLMLQLEKRTRLSLDSLLGILSHTTLALGLLIVSMADKYRLDILSFLYGDILSVSNQDVSTILVGSFFILGMFYRIWPSLLSLTLHKDLAAVEGVKVNRIHFYYVMLLAIFIAGAMKIVGILLITAMLVIPPATARRFAQTPEKVIGIAMLVGAMAVLGGLIVSLIVDVPTGPAIVVISSIMFGFSLFKKS